MDLFELARTYQKDRDRSIEQAVRLRRLLGRRADLPGPAVQSVDHAGSAGKGRTRPLPHVPARTGSSR